MPRVRNHDEILDLDDTRERFLAAAGRVILDEGLSLIENGLSAERVARIAGRTRRTFYDHFPAKVEFAREVINHYLDTSSHVLINESLASLYVAEIDREQGDVLAALTALASMNWQVQRSGTNVIMEMAAWSLGRSDPAVVKDLRDHYDRVDDAFAVGFEAILAKWQRKLRPPWDSHDAAAVLRAIGDGLYIRADLDAEWSGQLFTLTVLALFAALTQPMDEPAETVYDHLQAVSAEASLRWREQDEPSKVANSRARVIDALADELSRRGYGDTTLEHIAAAAGVSQRTIVASFGSIDEMITTALAEALPPLDQEVAFDLSSGIAPRAAAARHLQRVAQFCLDQRALIPGLIAVAVRPHAAAAAAAALVARLEQPLAEILRQGRAAGLVAPDVRARDAAEFCVEAILGRAAGPVPFEPDEIATRLATIIFASGTPAPTSSPTGPTVGGAPER